MAVQGIQALPADLFHLLAQQLSDNADFPTLYSCLVSSKQMANAGAVSALYRSSHERAAKLGGSEGLSLPEQELNVQKWSILWRSIILSALGKTLYPYCRHLRMLDLRDLGYLLEDDKFRGKISKHFFEGDLARFRIVMNTPGKGRVVERLDRNKIVLAVGDEITQQAPLLDAISEPSGLTTLSGALLTWVPRLGNLRRLELFDGNALADETVRNLLHAHCPNLDSLAIFRSSGSEADHNLATFIGGMPENRLVYFESVGDCGIATETCLALNSHGKSLQELKLALSEQGILALGLLQQCTAVTKLSIGAERTGIDLKATQNDVYLEVVEWLKNCVNLKNVSFHNMPSAPDLMTPILQNKTVALEELDINGRIDADYIVKDHQDFHRALRQQPSLRHLGLRADPDTVTRDDNDLLMNTLCSLTGLSELKLTRISDYFSDEHISVIGRTLSNLEDLYIGGYGISDAVLHEIAKLKKLKALTFSGVTNFTSAGLVAFIDQLGQGNHGLVLSVDMADPDTAITEEEQNTVRERIYGKLQGRFEYQLLRDPNMPEFDSDDSD
ncbi:hypothetical protein LTR37_010663 [Vermiconidia calcicola]|uniref:Uncharacterized protein n=1 Tax=Vermiconidia calcicola TaxID=1690605 RepID=A0ACC3N5Y0_9PEZI|nr:hypothetical protein LTR37_010663 [Vermiconidia calcicola]